MIPYDCTQSRDLVKLVTIRYCGEGTHIFDNGWQGRKDLLLTSGRDSSREGKAALRIAQCVGPQIWPHRSLVPPNRHPPLPTELPESIPDIFRSPGPNPIYPQVLAVHQGRWIAACHRLALLGGSRCLWSKGFRIQPFKAEE